MDIRINSQFNAEVTSRRNTAEHHMIMAAMYCLCQIVTRRSVTSALNCELILMSIGSNMCTMCVNMIVFKYYNCILAVNA